MTRVCLDHTQRRRRDRAIKTNRAGAKAAIQSQWTNLPNSGLTTALRSMAAPTNAPAPINATGQLRFTGACRDFTAGDFLPAPRLLFLARFIIGTLKPLHTGVYFLVDIQCSHIYEMRSALYPVRTGRCPLFNSPVTKGLVPRGNARATRRSRGPGKFSTSYASCAIRGKGKALDKLGLLAATGRFKSEGLGKIV